MDYNNINKDISNTNRDEITAAVDFAYKTIDTLALYAREKSDSVIDMLSKVSPNEMCNFGIRNGIYMMRLMRLNEKEKEITLNALGTDAVLNGDSSSITGAALSPSYAKGYDYVDNFVNIHKQDISSGIDVTSINKINNRSEELELGKRNLYHDDNGTGEFDNKINSVNLNSILNKTKRLFNQHKINTIISRFHTDSNLTENSMDVRTEYGLSHGRNLLTGDAQRGDSYPQNGYDNPYCRVWTHHYQYDNLDKRMRPFMDDGGVVLARDFHKWENFHNYACYLDGYDELSAEIDGKIIKSRVPRIKKEYGWKDDTYGWLLSVLGKNGFVNITPKFQGGGGKNIHTRQCMFSIENLAWKDYDPYSFEKALSWEQRGPMGGRIMWFPPYGINFQETTSTNWSANTFIGRGEDVYTYVNTVRTGTLNFMLLVDHPSILDYVSWGGRNNDTIENVSDDDVHRFFAGCDNVAGPGGSNETGGKLSDYAKPTPLTDEYVEKREEEYITPGKKPTPTQSTEPQISTDEDIKVTFYVFFPNNYSGYYDRCDNQHKTNVEAIPYLLYGKGAQMEPNEEPTGKDKNPTKNLPLSFENTYNNYGGGYEMTTAINKTYEGQKNYIIGTDIFWWKNASEDKTYISSKTKKWYYRIDGKYQMERITSLKPLKYEGEAIINCYDHKPTFPKNAYRDTKCFNFNSDISNVKDVFNEGSNTDLYSLSEVAQALANETIATVIAKNTKENNDSRIKKLKDIFQNNTLNSLELTGYSTEHGNTVNDELKNTRNKSLAINRAITVKEWLKKYWPQGKSKIDWDNVQSSTDPGHRVSGEDISDISGKTSKAYRSVKVVMHFKREASTTLPDANQKENSKANTGETLIKDIIKEIEKQVIIYRNTTDNKLTNNETDDIDKIISDCVNKLGSNYLKKVKAEIKEVVKDITLSVEVYRGHFTLYRGDYDIKTFIDHIFDISYTNIGYIISKDSISDALDELEFIYDGNYESRYYTFKRAILYNGPNRYYLPFCDETVNKLSVQLNYYSNKDDALYDFDTIETLLKDEFEKYLYIYIVNVNNEVIKEKTEKVMKILHKYNKNMDKSEYIGFSKHTDETTKEIYYINENETDKEKKNKKWVEEMDKNGKPTGKLVLKYIDGVDSRASVTYDETAGIVNIDNSKTEFNKSRYDQEYYFFRALKDKDRMTYEKVMEKIQYFDPAFHSMTPEGFSARLNFLNQCMRAGNTVTASDGSYAKSANNLAFGRPPFCVLRLGDWYNQMIVIDNISINYDPLVWDLNEEGIGVIPLIANVSMSFKFIGGGDLGGPVRRLQNAMSFNYYANGRLYDNRSDRMKYNWDNKTCGALKGNEIDTKNSYFYTAQNYKKF